MTFSSNLLRPKGREGTLLGFLSVGHLHLVDETLAEAVEAAMGMKGQAIPIEPYRSPVDLGPKRRLGRDGAPLGQRGGAPLFVNLAGDEMALLIEMVVDLGMN